MFATMETPRHTTMSRRAYLGSVRFVDEWISQLLDLRILLMPRSLICAFAFALDRRDPISMLIGHILDTLEKQNLREHKGFDTDSLLQSL